MHEAVLQSSWSPLHLYIMDMFRCYFLSLPVLMSVMDGKVSWQNVTFLTSWPILLQATDQIVYPVSGERDLKA
ncbi:hypothetical protein BgiBS90_020076 [Biomphalaria glabrata]|nr:hypothetical protein BgiBS90_020076 [Biomphalaria glabrata]